MKEANTQARYKAEYIVIMEQAHAILDQVGELISKAEALYNKRMAALLQQRDLPVEAVEPENTGL